MQTRRRTEVMREMERRNELCKRIMKMHKAYNPMNEMYIEPWQVSVDERLSRVARL